MAAIGCFKRTTMTRKLEVLSVVLGIALFGSVLPTSRNVASRIGPLAAFAATPVVIGFESLTTTGPGEAGQTVVNDQFAALGVVFNNPKALDYSKGLPIPNFAHSGTKAIEQC